MEKSIITQCVICGGEFSTWKYNPILKTSGYKCRSCGFKVGASKRTDTDRDAVYLKKQLRNIKSRCSGKYKHYKTYSDKKISLCSEWAENPNSFVDWAKANGWKMGLTIDRIDNSGNYEPSNCRWIQNVDNVLLKEKERKSRGKSKYVGVWYRKDTGKWCAEVKVDTKKVSLGCFDDEYDAAIARDRFILDKGLIHLKLNGTQESV